MTVAEVQQRVWLRRAAVLGAGVMGRTIAAHLANTGIPTVMLDLGDLAHKAHQSLRRIDPAPLFLPDLDRLIEPGSLENDLARAAEADWIIEAIIEDLPTKQALLARLLPFWRPGTVVTTNTSGLPVGRIAEETPAEFRRFFRGAHFFNPPRYMKLLEIIPTPDTDPAVTAAVAAWGDRLLGKGIVHCKDTPNFIANRLGTYGFLRTVQLMLEFGLSVEEVDELTGPLLGRPRTATFRLLDLAGLDVALAVAEHAYQNLPHDESRETFRPPAPLQEMVRRGWIGEKKGGGFYRRVDGEIQALDLSTMDYRPPRKGSSPRWSRRCFRRGAAPSAAGRTRGSSISTAPPRPPAPCPTGPVSSSWRTRSARGRRSSPPPTLPSSTWATAWPAWNSTANLTSSSKERS